MADAKAVFPRNQTMELAKLAAACLVVFNHCRFPGAVGSLIAYFSNFAVPMFFMISGYFNFRSSSGQILNRMKKIGVLYVTGELLRVLWLGALTLVQGGSFVSFLFRILPDQENLTGWIIYQEPILSGHLWYLQAMVVVYFLYWVYVRFRGENRADDKVLYFAGFVTFVVFFLAGVMMRIESGKGLFLYRNAYFMGFPFFVAGIFCRAYQSRLFECFALTNRKLAAAMVLGVVLTCQQWIRCGTGYSFGTLVFVAAFFLLLASNPKIVPYGSKWEQWILKCGMWSTWIYILHILVDSIYQEFFRGALSHWRAEALFYPVAVLLGAWIAAAVVVKIQSYLRILREKRKNPV